MYYIKFNTIKTELSLQKSNSYGEIYTQKREHRVKKKEKKNGSVVKILHTL